jgi:ketosteroid isomerase-like protein
MGDNAETVRRGFAAIAGSDLDSLLGTLHEDVRWRALLSHAPGETTFEGHDGVRRWWHRTREAYPDIEARFGDLIENGDVVYAEGSLGTTGGPEALQRLAWVVRLRDGKVSEMDVFTDRDEARAAAGLDQ